jgi:nitroreductase
LAEANQTWAKNAPVLLLATALNVFPANGKPNRWAQYDTGAASENICLQAVALGLVAHQMGGFDAEKAKTVFKLPDDVTAMAMIALGYQADPAQLNADLQARETAARERQALGALFFEGEWNVPVKT